MSDDESRIIYRQAKKTRRKKPKKGENDPKSAAGLASISEEQKAEIRRRRDKVWRLRLRGNSITTIAERLGVNFKTVRRDLKAIQRRIENELTDINALGQVAKVLHHLDTVTEAAWEEFDATKGALSKDRLLNTVLKAQTNKMDILMKVGAVPRTAVKIDADISVTDVVETLPKEAQTALSSPVSRQKVISAVRGLLQLGVAGEALKDADVESVGDAEAA